MPLPNTPIGYQTMGPRLGHGRGIRPVHSFCGRLPVECAVFSVSECGSGDLADESPSGDFRAIGWGSGTSRPLLYFLPTPAEGLDGSEILRRRTNDDLIDIDLGRLLDGVGNSASDGLGRNCPSLV